MAEKKEESKESKEAASCQSLEKEVKKKWLRLKE